MNGGSMCMTSISAASSVRSTMFWTTAPPTRMDGGSIKVIHRSVAVALPYIFVQRAEAALRRLPDISGKNTKKWQTTPGTHRSINGCTRHEKTIEHVYADAQEQHGIRYARYTGLAQVTNWVKLKFAAMNMKEFAKWSWRDTHSNFVFSEISFFFPKYTMNPCLAWCKTGVSRRSERNPKMWGSFLYESKRINAMNSSVSLPLFRMPWPVPEGVNVTVTGNISVSVPLSL